MKNKAKSIQLEGQKTPVCPYCNMKMNYEDWHVNIEDGYNANFECPKCEKLYYAKASVRWTTKKTKQNYAN